MVYCWNKNKKYRKRKNQKKENIRQKINKDKDNSHPMTKRLSSEKATAIKLKS